MRLWKALAIVLILVVAIAVAYAAELIHRGFSAQAQPSAIETVIATTARKLAVPSDYRNLRNPYPASPEIIQAGMEHFADHCSTCHANNGSGDTLFGKGLYPKPPDMRKPETQNKSDGELYYIIENGVRLSGMPAFSQVPYPNPNDAETWHLIVFIRHLPTLSDQELATMSTLNPKTEADRQEEKDEQEFLQGK